MEETNKPGTDLVTLAKTWIQRDYGFPLHFDEHDLWRRAGYAHRHHAKRAFDACVVDFKLVEGVDFLPSKVKNRRGRPSDS